VLDSGPLFRLGELQIEGLQRYPQASVRQLAEFGAGTPYSEKTLLDFQERLRKLGLFEAVTVEIDPDPAGAAAAPVLVRVREQPLQQATVGVGYSANTGQRVSVEHLHRRVFEQDFFGTSWVAKSKAELGRDQQVLEGEVLSHPLEGGYRNLLAASIERLDTAGTVVNSSRLRAGRSVDTERIERLMFAEALFVNTQDAAGSTSNQALSGNYHWIWRNLDSVVLPTEGLSANAQTALGYAVSDTAENGIFGRLYGRLTGYLPLGRAWYANARVEVGQVVVRDSVGVPETLLFRAGGDDSVRGYAYRSLGPVKNGVVSSGRMLFTASAELARPVSVKLPSVWWAAFVDAGNSADRWSDVKPVLGYGLGARWRSPVGPLRVDLAYGRDVHRYRLHFSVGIAF
jgi:translocation and assembly module TamA